MKNIFIIDDDFTNNFIAEILIKSVFPEIKLLAFTSPEQALLTLSNINLAQDDIILLDLNMPEMDGFQFIEKFNEKKLNCRVFILTTSLNPLDKELAESKTVVCGFILKPLTKERITSFNSLY